MRYDKHAGSAEKMGSEPVPGLLVHMAFPLAASLFIQGTYNFVDSIYVGHIGKDALTAVSIAYPVQMMIVAVAVGTAVGLNSLLSRLLGEKEEALASEAATTGLVLAFLTSLVIMAAGLFGAEFFVSLFTNDTAIARGSTLYLKICMVFSSGVQIQCMVMRFLQASGKNVLSMVTLLVGAAVNLIMDPIMIFGFFGFPAMGVAGAGIATVAGQWIGGIASLFLNCRYNREVLIRFKGFRLRRKVVKEIYKVGIPAIFTQALGGVAVSFMNALIGDLSASAVAFYGVYIRIRDLLFNLVVGTGQAAISISAYNYGNRSFDRIKKLANVAIPAVTGVSMIIIVIFLVFPGQLLRVFSSDPELIETGITGMRILALSLIGYSVTIVAGYIIAGLGNGMINMISSFLRQLILLMPFAYIFGKFMGISGVWYASWIAEYTAMAYCLISMRKEFRQKLKEPFLSDISCRFVKHMLHPTERTP